MQPQASRRGGLGHAKLGGASLFEPALVDPFEEAAEPRRMVQPESRRQG